MTWIEIVCFLLVATGVGLVIVGRRQAGRRLGRGSSLGTRTRQTSLSEAAWAAGNEAAAPYSYAQGAVCIAAGLVGILLGGIIATVAIGAAAVAVLVLAGFQVARANAAAEHAESGDTP